MTTSVIAAPPRPSEGRSATRKLHRLNKKLIRLSRKRDWLRLRDLMRSVAISGSPSSGKTSTMYYALARSCWADGHCGAIFCSKPDAAQQVIALAKHAGRGASIREMKERGELHVNPIDWAMMLARQTGIGMPISEASACLSTILEILHRGDVAKEAHNFFGPAQEELQGKVMKVVYRATGRCDIKEVVECCRHMPDGKPDAFDDPSRYPILRHMEAIRRAGKWDAEMDDLLSYFKQVAVLNHETQSSIQISATVRMAPLLEEPIYSLFFKHPTNITPEMIDRENLLLVINFPFAHYRNIARAIGAAIKEMCQKYAMSRTEDSNPCPFGLWLDEGFTFCTDLDIEAAERGRSARLYSVWTYQSLGTAINGYGGGQVGESKARALLAAIGVHAFFSQTDFATREYAEKMVGKVYRWMKQISDGKSGGGAVGSRDGWSQSTSWSLQLVPALPEENMLGLETGANKKYAQCYLFDGRKWRRSGERYLLVRWFRPLGIKGYWIEPFLERNPTARSWVCHVGLLRFIRMWWDDGFEKALRCALRFWTKTMAAPVAEKEADHV